MEYLDVLIIKTEDKEENKSLQKLIKQRASFGGSITSSWLLIYVQCPVHSDFVNVIVYYQEPLIWALPV